MKRKKRNLSAWLDEDAKQIIAKFATVGLILSVVVFVISTAIDISRLGDKIDGTMEHLKQQCVGYEGVFSADKVKSLIRLTEQTAEISSDIALNPSTLNEDYIKEYCDNQRIAGVILLDAQLRTELDYSNRGMSFADWSEEITDNAVSDIADYPTKFYAERTFKNGRCFDLAAAARRDKPGIVFCYRYQNPEVMTINKAAIKNLMSVYEIDFKGSVFVTEGNAIRGTNIELRDGSGADDIGILQEMDKKATDDVPTFFMSNGMMYYGEKRQYKNYGLYVVYPLLATMGFTERTTMSFAGIYIILCMAVYLIRGYSEKRHIMEINRQNETIKSIGNIYLMYIIIDIEHDTYNIVKATERFKGSFDGAVTASELLDTIRTRFMQEGCRDEYKKFVELKSLNERLAGKDYIEMIHCNDMGCWIRDIIIPNAKSADGRIKSVILALRDIDDSKKKEIEYQEKLKKATAEAMRANAAKTDFLRRMSHDVRTPINVIMGMVEIGSREPDNVKRQSYCREKVLEAATMLLELVDDVLFVNKMDSDNSAAESKPFDIRTILGDVCSMIDVQAQEKGLDFIIEPLSAQHYRFLGGPLHLRQILMNIAGNAVKYTPSGGRVTLSCSEVSSDGKKSVLRFVCEDTGVGMSADFQMHMFEPFEQEDDIPRSEYGGIGLGLAIVKSLVDRMQGSISVTSERNKGTCFKIEIPFCIDPNEDQKDKVPKRERAVSVDGAHILLVEDNALNMEIAEFVLEEKGAIVTKAWDGEQAEKIWKNTKAGTFDIILMDLMMPGVGGIEATRRIRASGTADAETVPIIAMSANIFKEDIKRCDDAGMTDHISKPLDMDKLTEIIARYAQKNQGSKEV